MSTARRALLAALSIVPFTACYHATIDTGRPVAETVIDQPWAMSFVYGLVPPPAVNTASACPNGLAKVETQHSFMNGLVGMLTFGIVTPIHIKVSCAAGAATASLQAAPNASAQAVVQAAAEQAVRTEAPVVVQF